MLSQEVMSFGTEKAVRVGKSPFPNVLSEFVYTRSYSRWVPSLGRRERWHETVGRYMDFLSTNRDIPVGVFEDLREGILSMQILPSMRALWAAGPAAERDNISLYNCAMLLLDSVRSFSELLLVLMQGSGCGFSVERRFVENLPVVAPSTGRKFTHVIQDSTEGWSEALYVAMTAWWKGDDIDLDYSLVRPAGMLLKTKGGRASGPRPLAKLMAFTKQTLRDAEGRKLRPIECHDIACQIAEIVMVGGFRRAATISISDLDDEEMRHAKDWSEGKSFPSIRYMANNSTYYVEKPTEEDFWKEWDSLRASGSGERGIFRVPETKKMYRRGGILRPNPCGEVLGRVLPSKDPWAGAGGGGGTCNLSAAVMRADDTVQSFAEKVRRATWLGAIQATFSHFPNVRAGWKKTAEEDRLLGVDITGQCDNPKLSGDREAMLYFNRVARETAAAAAAYYNINMPAAISLGKPSGNSSQLVDCASGFSARWSPWYYRHVRISGNDPLFRLVRDAGVPVFKENGMDHLPDNECPVWVVRFPVKAPAGAKMKSDESAIEQCERYRHIMQTWCSERGHNQSVTIYVQDHEWEDVGRWVYDHFDEVVGMTFLPADGGRYRLAPYEAITESDYIKAVAAMPHIDFTRLSRYEEEDRGEGAKEYACQGGACEL